MAHFTPFFVLLTLTCLLTLFDSQFWKVRLFVIFKHRMLQCAAATKTHVVPPNSILALCREILEYINLQGEQASLVCKAESVLEREFWKSFPRTKNLKSNLESSSL